MRCAWPILVGIAVLGCKDKPAAKPTEGPSAGSAPAPATPDAASGPAAINAPAPPSLKEEFEAESEDSKWADAQEKALKKVAPEAASITCRTNQCEVTLAAGTMQELVTKAEALQRPEALMSTGAKSLLLAAPEGAGGDAGALSSIKIYVRYDR